MTDTVKSWIEERRAIHSASGAGDWEKRLNGHDYEIWEPGEFDDAPVSSFSADPDASAIVDAHNMFPRALDAIEQASKLADRLRESAYIFEVLGDSPTVVEERRATARMIDRVIESALEAGE